MLLIEHCIVSYRLLLTSLIVWMCLFDFLLIAIMVYRMIKLGKRHDVERQRRTVLEAYKDLEYRISEVHLMTASLKERTTTDEPPTYDQIAEVHSKYRKTVLRYRNVTELLKEEWEKKEVKGEFPVWKKKESYEVGFKKAGEFFTEHGFAIVGFEHLPEEVEVSDSNDNDIDQTERAEKGDNKTETTEVEKVVEVEDDPMDGSGYPEPSGEQVDQAFKFLEGVRQKSICRDSIKRLPKCRWPDDIDCIKTLINALSAIEELHKEFTFDPDFEKEVYQSFVVLFPYWVTRFYIMETRERPPQIGPFLASVKAAMDTVGHNVMSGFLLRW